MPVGDAELDAVAAFLKTEDPHGVRTANAVRRTIDMLLDGQRTGRFRWQQLNKTEKTYAGTLVEINLQRAFGFDDGTAMDYRIEGVEVDCKFSQDRGKWMIPPEAMGHLCLGLWANDDAGLWSAGLFRVTEDVLTAGTNRDRKRTLTAPALGSAVRWLHHESKLPENVLLRLPESDLARIFGHKHGTKRVDELFRLAQGRRVSRTVVATVAMQDDYMKRVRGNGGSRSSLRREGIVIFGQYFAHAPLAGQLGLPIPGQGEFVSARLVPATGNGRGHPPVYIEGKAWALAQPGDPVVEAPLLPDTKKASDGE